MDEIQTLLNTHPETAELTAQFKQLAETTFDQSLQFIFIVSDFLDRLNKREHAETAISIQFKAHQDTQTLESLRKLILKNQERQEALHYSTEELLMMSFDEYDSVYKALA